MRNSVQNNYNITAIVKNPNQNHHPTYKLPDFSLRRNITQR